MNSGAHEASASTSLTSPRGGDSSVKPEDRAWPLSSRWASRKGQLLLHWTARVLWGARLTDSSYADSSGTWGPRTSPPEPLLPRKPTPERVGQELPAALWCTHAGWHPRSRGRVGGGGTRDSPPPAQAKATRAAGAGGIGDPSGRAWASGETQEPARWTGHACKALPGPPHGGARPWGAGPSETAGDPAVHNAASSAKPQAGLTEPGGHRWPGRAQRSLAKTWPSERQRAAPGTFQVQRRKLSLGEFWQRTRTNPEFEPRSPGGLPVPSLLKLAATTHGPWITKPTVVVVGGGRGPAPRRAPMPSRGT